MAYGDVYILRHEAVVSTAITILQIATGAAVPLEILSAQLGQDGSTVSAQEKVAFVRKSAAATVTAAAAGTHLFKTKTGDPTSGVQLGTALTGVIASAEGTDTDVLYETGFNVLNGWVYLPVPEERIYMPGGAFLGLKFRTAPASATWQMQITFRELGG